MKEGKARSPIDPLSSRPIKKSGLRMREKILVVDDEQVLRDLASEVLSEEGYHVSLASSGQEALEQMKQMSFDLVIADLKMPGMDGMELLKRIKENDKGVQVILLTSYLSPTTALSSLEAGAFWYLTKPLDDIRVFTEKVKLALKAKKKGKGNKTWERS
jgi:CheY-like chemotaxis protein